jgi:hypothetical protein
VPLREPPPELKPAALALEREKAGVMPGAGIVPAISTCCVAQGHLKKVESC